MQLRTSRLYSQIEINSILATLSNDTYVEFVRDDGVNVTYYKDSSGVIAETTTYGTGGGASSFSATTAQALVQGRAVIPTSANTVDYADNTSTENDSFAVGVIIDNAASGTSVDVHISNVVSCPAWSFTFGDTIYLGANGVLTSTQPATGDYITVLGVATASDKIKIDIRFYGQQL